MVDLDMMPPDWEFAKKHAKANRPGISEGILDLNSANDFCPCCHQPIIKQELPLCHNSKQLQFMGFGFPLYFIFIKYCIILLVILICSYNIISLYWGSQGARAYCSHRLLSENTEDGAACSSRLIYWANIEQSVADYEVLVRVVSFVVHLLGLLYVRDTIRKTMEYYDQKNTSLSDYSVIIKNLPPKEGLQKGITDFIHSHFDQKWEEMDHAKRIKSWKDFEEEQKVVEVIVLPDLQEYYKLQKQKKNLIKQKKSLFKRQDKIESRIQQNLPLSEKDQEELNNITEMIRKINEQIDTEHRKMDDLAHQSEVLADEDKLISLTAIVSLHSEYLRTLVLKYAKKNTLNSALLKEHFGEFEGQIHIENVAEPTQIIWKNGNYSKKKIYLSWLLGWVLSILFICLITVAFYFLLTQKGHYLEHAIQQKHEGISSSKYAIAIFLVYFGIVMIVLFGKLVMGYVLHYFTHFQKHFTTSGEEFSFGLKYTLGLFFTTAVMTLAIEGFTFGNYYTHEFGVVEQESIMFIINASLVPVIWIINPWQIYKWFLRKLSYGKKHFTQEEANQIMCDTQYTMGKRYAEVIESMWFTFLYATLIPSGAFFTIVGLGLYYWVDKFNLIKRSSVGHEISGDLAVVSLKLLDFTLILKPIGEMIFDRAIRNGVQTQSIVLACIGGFYLLLPVNKILEFFHDETFMQQEKTFKEVRENFLHTYLNTHPILCLKNPKQLKNKQNPQSAFVIHSNGNIMSKTQKIDPEMLNMRKSKRQAAKRALKFNFVLQLSRQIMVNGKHHDDLFESL